MSEDKNKAIWVISFDDKKQSYKTWAKKCLTAATLRCYNIVLTEKDPKVCTQDLVLKDTEEDKRKLKLSKAHQQTYCELMLVCQGTINFAIYPQTSANELKLKRQFTNSSLMDWKQDPDDWITELDILQTLLEEMGHTISDKDFMINILNNLPTEYKNKVESLKKDLDNMDYPLTLDQMIDELDLKYEKIHKKNKYDP